MTFTCTRVCLLCDILVLWLKWKLRVAFFFRWWWVVYPAGPHDMFKGAIHLSLERAPSSKHSGSRGYKQMVYKRCRSGQTDWTDIVISWVIPPLWATAAFRGGGTTEGDGIFTWLIHKLPPSVCGSDLMVLFPLGVLLILHNVLVICQ